MAFSFFFIKWLISILKMIKLLRVSLNNSRAALTTIHLQNPRNLVKRIKIRLVKFLFKS